MTYVLSMAIAFLKLLGFKKTPEKLMVFEQRFDTKREVTGWRVSFIGGWLRVKKDARFNISIGGLFEKLDRQGALGGLDFVHIVRPDKATGLTTNKLVHAWQFLLYSLSNEKSYAAYSKKASDEGYPHLQKAGYEKMLEEGRFKTMHFCLAHGNIVKPGNKVPVAMMGTLSQWGEVFKLSGEALVKLILGWVKKGMPAETPATSVAIKGFTMKVGVVPEAELILTDVYKKAKPKIHDGPLFVSEKVKVVAALYQTDLKKFTEEPLSFKLLVENIIRLRGFINGVLTIVKGLLCVIPVTEFEELINKFGLPDDVDLITSDGNIKQGDKSPVQYWDSTMFDLINIGAADDSKGTFGPQGVLLDQFAAYELFDTYNWCLFKQLDGKYVRRRPIEVFMEACLGDFAAWRHILMRKSEATWEDFVVTSQRTLFFPIKDSNMPSGYRVPMYMTSYRTLANRLEKFLTQHVLRVSIPSRSNYLTMNTELDDLLLHVKKTEDRDINPVIPQNNRRVRAMVKRYCMKPDYRKCIISHPVVGPGQVQAISFVARVNGELVEWKPEMGFDAILFANQMQASAKYHHQAVKDNDGDMVCICFYKGVHDFPVTGFPDAPEVDDTPVVLPTDENDIARSLMNMYIGLEGIIGKIDLAGRRIAFADLRDGQLKSTKELIALGWLKEQAIKASMRPGSTKFGAITNMDDFLDDFVAKASRTGRMPYATPLFSATTTSQGVFGEQDFDGVEEYVGAASRVNGFLNNCKNGLKELHKIQSHGLTLMYKDIVEYVAARPNIKFRPVASDAFVLHNFAAGMLKNGTSQSEFVRDWAEDLALCMCEIHDDGSKAILGMFQSGKGEINSVEKSARFTKLARDVSEAIEFSTELCMDQVYEEKGVEPIHRATCLLREKALRLSLLYACKRGFEYGRPGSAFWFYPSSTRIWLARRWWRDNPVIPEAEKAYAEWMTSKTHLRVDE